MCVFNFSRFSVFLAIFKSYSVCVSFYTFFSFLTIFQVLPCVCLLVHIFQVSGHYPGPIVCIYHFSCFFQCFYPHSQSYSVYFLYSTFFSFSPYSMSYIVHFSSFTFFRLLSMFHVLQYAFLFFHVFHIFFDKCQVLHCAFLIFDVS